jgi:hypothetical protein
VPGSGRKFLTTLATASDPQLFDNSETREIRKEIRLICGGF